MIRTDYSFGNQELTDTLDVLNLITEKFKTDSTKDVSSLRISCCKELARKRGVTENTIFAHLISKPRKPLTSVQIDHMIKGWLHGESTELQEWVSRRVASKKEKEIICEFFSSSSTKLKPTMGEILNTELDEIEAKSNSFEPDEVVDTRNRTLVALAIRQNRSLFRSMLIKLYGGKCAITGCDIQEILEAAHIFPYRGVETNDLTNGLLLRPDIHTLLDLGYISISKNYKVRVSSQILQSNYAELEGKMISFPAKEEFRPSISVLEYHMKEVFRP